MYVFVRKHFFIKGKANSFEFTEETADFLLREGFKKRKAIFKDHKKGPFIFFENIIVYIISNETSLDILPELEVKEPEYGSVYSPQLWTGQFFS